MVKQHQELSMAKAMQPWLGDQASFDRLVEIESIIKNATPEQLAAAQAYEDDWGKPDNNDHWMLDMQGEVAVITVVGPLIKGSSGWWGKYCGYVGYDDILEACNCGIDQGASTFVFDWDSPGGMVGGIEDAATFLRNLSKNFATVSYTSNMVASACLWLATTADEFYASKMASIGSIGVIAVQKEFTKMMEMDGVTPHVFRSAPYKALGGPYEKLSEKAKESIQKDIDTSHGFFVDAITANCGLPRDYVAENLATGEIWYGEEALAKGLIDGVKTFDEVFVALQRENIENTTDYKNPPSEVTMKPKRISAKTQAAVASGVPLAVALEDEETIEESAEDSTEETQDDPTDVLGNEATATGLIVTTASSDFTKELTNQLIDAKVALASAEAKILGMEASHVSMKNIVAQAIQRCYVGMGSPAPDKEGLVALDASLLVQQFTQVDAQLTQRFGIGARVSTDASGNEDDEALKKASELNTIEEDQRMSQARIKKPS